MTRLAGAACLVVLFSLAGCLSPLALHQAVISYDETINQVGAEELLLNLARVSFRHPVHFTAVSSVAATFNFQVSAGAGPPPNAAETGKGLVPMFGASVSENPTITLLPIQGEEFNRRVLTPVTEPKLVTLLQQGADLGVLFRLLVAEFRLEEPQSRRVIWNRPGRRTEYEDFRRRVLHLVALREANQLFIEPLVVEHRLAIPIGSSDQAEVVLSALEKGYRWEEQGAVGTLAKKVVGRVVISNFDPDDLPREERQRLYLYANALPDDEVYLDIRPGFPGGEFAMRGVIRLRGFLGVLNFLGQGMGLQPEYHVEKDPRSGPVRQNPPRTLDLVIGSTRPTNAAFSVDYGGRVFSVLDAEDDGAVWNLEAFRLLRQIFELSVSPSEFFRPAPSITIAK